MTEDSHGSLGRFGARREKVPWYLDISNNSRPIGVFSGFVLLCRGFTLHRSIVSVLVQRSSHSRPSVASCSKYPAVVP